MSHGWLQVAYVGVGVKRWQEGNELSPCQRAVLGVGKYFFIKIRKNSAQLFANSKIVTTFALANGKEQGSDLTVKGN